MIPFDKPNPFLVLGLPTDATTEEVSARGQERVETVDSDDERQLCRWAMEQLLTNPTTRLEYELFEVPGAQYEDPDWDRFVRSYRKNPVDTAALARESPPPQVTDFDLGVLTRVFLDYLLAVPPGDLSPAIDHPPYDPDLSPLPLEVRDVLFG